MSMYNLFEYSSNFSKTIGSFCFYSKDEGNADVRNKNDFKSFYYKRNLAKNILEMVIMEL